MGQYDINLRDYWRIIRKRKMIIIFTTVLLAIFSFIFAKLNEPAPIYSSSSAIRIDQNTAVSGLVGDGAFNQFQEMSTQTAVIRSYPVMQRVAKELGLIDKSLSSAEIAKNSRLVSIINGLSEQTETEQIGETNLIRIQVTSGDPDQAARMANTIASIFRGFDYETRNEAILKQSDFINGQLKASEQALKIAELNIKKYKEENNVLSVSIEATIVSRTLQTERKRVTEIKKALSKLRDAIQQVRFIGEFQAGKTKRIPVDDIESGLGPLNKQLVQLQVQRDTLLENFTTLHPSVRTILVQIRNVVREMLLVLEGREHSFAAELEYRTRELKKAERRNNEIPNISLAIQRLERRLGTNMEVHNLLRQKSEEVKIKLAGTQHLVHIVKPAFRPTFRDNPPQVGVNTFVGALLGLIVGAVFALVLETMDTSIGAIEDVESYLEIPVLGVIPMVDAEELEQEYLASNPEKEGRFTPDTFGRLVTHFVPRSPVAEAYRSFRTQMDFLALEKGGNLFLLTSTTPGEGKTTTAINFAIAYAQTNKRTLLIDADMRKPTIYRVFGIDREPGLTEILLGNYTADECIRTMTDIMLGKFDMEDIMITPGLDNLSIMTCGNIPPNPSELLGSPRMTDFLEEVRGEFDIIIIDTPPVLPVTDAAILSPRVDGVVLVYRVGTIARGALKRAKIQLDNVRANVWGVVLNSMRAEVSADIDTFQYQSGYYYAGYSEEAEEDSTADMPIYQRWYTQAKNLIAPTSDGEILHEEASPLARILGAALIIFSFALIAGGIFWQQGVDLPLFGSLKSATREIGEGSNTVQLDALWESLKKYRPRQPAIPKKVEPAPSGGAAKENPPPAPGNEAPTAPGQKTSALDRAPLENKGFRKVALRVTRPSEGEATPPGGLLRPKLSAIVLQRRAAFRRISQGVPALPAGAEKPRHPFSIILSVNRLRSTTEKQLRRLKKAGLTAHFVQVPTTKGLMDRLYLGAFETPRAARKFLQAQVTPATPKGESPFVDRLPYALEVGRELAPGEADVLRVILKAAGFSPREEKKNGSVRILVGAFRQPGESVEAARLLQSQAISFRLIAR